MSLSAKPNHPAWLPTKKEPCSFTFLFLAANTHVLSPLVEVLVQGVTTRRGPAVSSSQGGGAQGWAIENRNSPLWHQGLPGSESLSVPQSLFCFLWDYVLFPVNSDVAESYDMYWPLASSPGL